MPAVRAVVRQAVRDVRTAPSPPPSDPALAGLHRVVEGLAASAHGIGELMLEVAPAYLCDTEAGSLEPATRAPGRRRTACSASTSVPVSAAPDGHTSTARTSRPSAGWRRKGRDEQENPQPSALQPRMPNGHGYCWVEHPSGAHCCQPKGHPPGCGDGGHANPYAAPRTTW